MARAVWNRDASALVSTSPVYERPYRARGWSVRGSSLLAPEPDQAGSARNESPFVRLDALRMRLPCETLRR